MAIAEIIAGMKTWRLWEWIAFIFICVGAMTIATSSAQPAATGEIKGHVVDSVGATINGAKVFVHKNSPSQQDVKLAAHTDIHGDFVLHLPQGGYDVLVTSPGFVSEVETIPVFSGKTRTVKWKLRGMGCDFPGMNCDSVQ